ncbi:MAG TPA: SOS response-associated peptidase [Terriglobales bacterium]|nr:SOS response-associated peptidase [Terriglobales bacterium]
MCGRYRLGRGREAFKKYFGADREGYDWSPRFNIAPTQQVPVIRQDAKEPLRLLSDMRWGLIPFWAKDPSIGAKMINARSEDAAAKPAFKESLSERRCLIPADRFYEWQKQPKSKQPYCFQLADEAVFALAGIWDHWRTPQGSMLETCSILTTSPNTLTQDVHDRMPVILPPEHYDLWLDPGFHDVASITELLKPYDPQLMKKFPVSTRVNAVANDDPECSAPAHSAQAALGF